MAQISFWKRSGERERVKIPYNRNEIRRRIESGIPPATAEEYLLRVRYAIQKKKTRERRKNVNTHTHTHTDSKLNKCQIL